MKSNVYSGQRVGRTIGFPTLNLESSSIPPNTKKGVYASWVTIQGKRNKGALYYGPRLVLGESEDVLEIYVLDFDQDIYGQQVSFTLEKYIRGILDLPDLTALKNQLAADAQAVDDAL